MTTVQPNDSQQTPVKQSPTAEVSPTSTPVTQTTVNALVSNTPKIGTMIPNRIFVGGIPANTTEQELKAFFSTHGQVKDVKIISERAGVSKGYGFVTFEDQGVADKIIKNESENLIFKDRKLNIGPAVRKHQMFSRPEIPGAVFFTNGSVPYTYHNGMAVFHVPGQDYPVISQQPSPYAAMMMPQPTVYMPQPQYAYQAPTALQTGATAAGLSQNFSTPVSAAAQAVSQWQAAGNACQSSSSASANAVTSLANTAAGQQWRWAAAGPQSPPAAAVAPMMYIHQTGSYTPNSTSDYSSDHTGLSTSLLDSSEQSLGSPGNGHQYASEACMSPYNLSDHVLQLQPNLGQHKIYASPGPHMALCAPQILPAHGTSLKSSHPQYTITRVLPPGTSMMQTSKSSGNMDCGVLKDQNYL